MQYFIFYLILIAVIGWLFGNKNFKLPEPERSPNLDFDAYPDLASQNSATPSKESVGPAAPEKKNAKVKSVKKPSRPKSAPPVNKAKKRKKLG